MKNRILTLVLMLTLLSLTLLACTKTKSYAFGLMDDGTVCKAENCLDPVLESLLKEKYSLQIAKIEDELKSRVVTTGELKTYTFTNNTRFDRVIEIVIRLNIVVCELDSNSEFLKELVDCEEPVGEEGFIRIYMIGEEPFSTEEGFRKRQ